MTHSERLREWPTTKGNMGNWQERHIMAVLNPAPGLERPVILLIEAWLDYADAHKSRYETGIGEDGVLGDNWSKIGMELLGLLNGDCGTLDGVIRGAMQAEGFDPDTM